MRHNREFRLILKRIKKMNNWLILNALFIVGISITTIYSATISKSGAFHYKEAVWAGISIFAYMVVSMIDYKKYLKYYKVLYVFNILFLGALLVIGDSRLGAQRWISLGPISLQPSEVGKVIVVLTLSAFISINFRDRTIGFKKFFTAGLFILPVLLLILKQPDLGTTLIICFTFFVILFMANLEWKTIITMGIVGAISAPLSFFFLLKDYQRTRILTFLNPESDPLKSGWNVTQSMIAIGSGGLYGKGFLNSTQSKLRFLPEAHTDFIASVFLEERGFVGGVLLFVLYFLLIMQILYIADTTEDKYGKLICYGIAAIFFFHFVINVGMTMGIMPVTGKPLLLMSYGGTSLLLSFIMLGIVQSVRIYRE
ncbi:Peptidoglycan glycosyltransferase MrdB [Fusobacterium sp. DD29]|uniref:rod shape-determining protein RodA n=1 Tax=unclassified Fusobacterium TaxID=2648384 RepID=UPI001B8D47AE|nr:MULTISPECIES: rod shape-determining protein RodA [unclassified Fusobacterium]MBR8700783.1 Peptidoglycan glycosyltransferase MrdB [Fusobacterium sp. DD45]MBR8710562.1 Peptidoglycan glycosyltransferase MrdB [Fusobacterium sp. DD28]MBR8748994.1 Peptidoglycan glycosyltransferase MrdB [Fusobacterium sp. DD29]MBR8751168.1 Peptidoglycan glycosyltransferase MrdB [Fusobacterium sp. DD26]MBR8761201.1 Peptidoglycan glycosyltransferase MrdB [Fusobacterium sp. DD25]